MRPIRSRRASEDERRSPTAVGDKACLIAASDADLIANQRCLHDTEDQQGYRTATAKLREREAFIASLTGVVDRRLVRRLLRRVQNLVGNRLALG